MGGVDVRQGNENTHPLLEAAANGHLDSLKVSLNSFFGVHSFEGTRKTVNFCVTLLCVTLW